ncbi:MAG: hypothetical protein R2729_26865 [Bryobacteraceae bacterium]
MKYCALALLAAGAFAQSQNQTTYTYDINGRRTAVASTSTTKSGAATSSTTMIQSINNGAVPVTGSDQRVISDGPNGRVVERIVKKYDQNGRPSGTEKVRIEERKNADGSTTTQTTIYDSDINGGYMARQRSVAQTSTSGGVTRTDTAVQTPSLNGGFDVTEKRLTIEQGDEKNSQKDLTVYRKDTNGRFAAAAREITQVQTTNGQQVTTTNEFNTASTGKMELTGQKVSTLEKRPDGTELMVTDVYGQTASSQLGAPQGQPQLREQQIVQKKNGANGSVTETFSVRRPAADSKRLGPPLTISQTVCTGTCTPPPPTPAPPQAAQGQTANPKP